MSVVGPNTNFVIVNADGGTTNIDLGNRYVSKDYLLDAYPNIVSTTGNRSSPSLWAWGQNNNQGQLGLSDIVNRSSPVQVGTTTSWKQIACGDYHTVAVTTDGKLFAWGSNSSALAGYSYGQLGLSDTVHRSSPVQVGALTTWRLVAAGDYTTMAVKNDGSLWAWGWNAYGALGLNDIVHRSSPVQVGSLTNWKQIATGAHTAAVKTDGTLWTCGWNTYGALGQNDIVYRSSPTQVGSLNTWKQVSIDDGGYRTIAVTNDGKLWAWGGNTNGGLGLGDVTHRSSPVQVGSLTNWKQVMSAGNWFAIAVKTDGTLWAWGLNSNGQLGLNDTTTRSSPVQVGTLTNWKKVASNGPTGVVAIKTDGTIWGWGSNASGNLGLGDTNPRSSPVQIGSLTNWKQIVGGTSQAWTMAIQEGIY